MGKGLTPAPEDLIRQQEETEYLESNEDEVRDLAFLIQAKEAYEDCLEAGVLPRRCL